MDIWVMCMCFPVELFICYKAASVKFNEYFGSKVSLLGLCFVLFEDT